jgi:hypothetical protein
LIASDCFAGRLVSSGDTYTVDTCEASGSASVIIDLFTEEESPDITCISGFCGTSG